MTHFSSLKKSQLSSILKTGLLRTLTGTEVSGELSRLLQDIQPVSEEVRVGAGATSGMCTVGKRALAERPP